VNSTVRDLTQGGRERRAWIVDTAIAVGFTAAVLGITRKLHPDNAGERALDALGYGCIVVAGLALAWRRRFPMAVLAVVTSAIVVYATRTYTGGPVYVAPIIAMYTVGSLYPRRQWAPAVVLSATVVSTAGIINYTDAGTRWFHVVYFTWGIAAGFIGAGAQSRREHAAALEERAKFLEETREEEARRQVAEERLRIARDLHDVVAHSLASINIQAGAGAHVAPTHPDQAQAALVAIKQASKEALEELRLTLGVLRTGDESAPRAPLPSLARLDALVARTQAAGLAVSVEVAGPVAALRAAVDAAAYRIVQESLTNALRHAGPAARASVTLTYDTDGSLVIDVVDDGLGNASAGGTPGHGITGMRERALGLGGTLRAGPVAGGGFAVHAELPAPAEVSR
jgi:signal transduction histidine kinase